MSQPYHPPLICHYIENLMRHGAQNGQMQAHDKLSAVPYNLLTHLKTSPYYVNNYI